MTDSLNTKSEKQPTEQNDSQPNNSPDLTEKSSIKKNRKTYAIAGIIFTLGLAIAGIIIFYLPASNYFVLKNANPAMLTLAQQAGMSKEGELIFLRANPQFATDAQMRSDCSDNAAANNKNGFVEQGCYVPNLHDNALGRIYIRQMPSNLYDQEIVAATYEMLHSVYFSSTNSELVMAIENNYNRVHNHSLDEQVVNFAKTEPGYRDLELFSLLGSEYSKLTPELEADYTPYFTDRALTVDSYNRVTAIFLNEQSQLKQIQSTITSDDSAANAAYADSIAWAKAGNTYEDSYNYNIYKNYIAQENTAINQYNQLSQAYNTLVTEYNGSQPVNSIQNITVQNSK